MYNKYRNIWNAFKTNSFSVVYGDAPRIAVLTKQERILVDDEINEEISNQMKNNTIMYEKEATAIVLQRIRQELKPLYAKIYNLEKALPAEVLQTHYECECGSKVVFSHKSHHLKTQLHLNFINKVEVVKPEKLTHYDCECGSKVVFSNKSHHLKSVKHLNFVNKVEVIPKESKAETKVDCGCGKSFSPKNKSHHIKTQYHLDWEKIESP
jgi:DNA-directed RNA polymerase subunit RPC12/RpoP